MSDQISDQARRDVNNAIMGAGSAAVGQLVDTANSSKFKREEARKKREEEERRKKEEKEKSKVRACASQRIGLANVYIKGLRLLNTGRAQ
jgi:hypothetical protein